MMHDNNQHDTDTSGEWIETNRTIAGDDSRAIVTLNIDSNVPCVPIGIVNQGYRSCYVNSVLQV